MSYAKISYDNVPYAQQRRPLMIGCSGGGGHIAAIQGIREYLGKQFQSDKIDFPLYDPVLYEEKPVSPARDEIATGVELMNAPVIGTPIKALVSPTHLPVLPEKQSLNDEIQALSNKEKGKKRTYVDMLLDVYPAGYESAAIWNVLQRNDKISELTKLINLQPGSDTQNHPFVLSYFVNALKDAAIAGTPYTEIISTQAMALPALCDAVIEYNKWLVNHPQINAPKVMVHQYMTDLPTKGAVHFFNPLSALSAQQQQQMKLYGVGMKEETIDYFFPEGHAFNDIFNIPSQENPMVRLGFIDGDFDSSSKFHEPVSIILAGEAPQPYVIAADEQIASIMLGSQASNDTVEYIETLLENGMERVFVFGGKNPAILEKINEILNKHPEYAGRIIPLGNQGDKEIASLMSRSNMVIIRGGGLSVMEQLCMDHSPEQTVLIHHANSSKEELTSGISWEDDNVNTLLTDLRERGVHADKTSPDRAVRQIAEARLIAAVKRLHNTLDIEDATHFITKLPDNKLTLFVNQLKHSEQQKVPSLPRDLFVYFQKCEVLAEIRVDVLKDKLNKGQAHLASIIIQEVAEYEGVNPSDVDVNNIVHDFDMSAFKDISSKLTAAIQSYRAVNKLDAILHQDTEGSMEKKLREFKTEFNQPETQNELMATSDGLIRRILKSIESQLAKYFSFIANNLSFQQDFKKHMNDLKENDSVLIVPIQPGRG